MTDLLRALLERMIRDPGTSLVSVLMATLVWLFVQNQQTDEGSLRIPVAFRGIRSSRRSRSASCSSRCKPSRE